MLAALLVLLRHSAMHHDFVASDVHAAVGNVPVLDRPLVAGQLIEQAPDQHALQRAVDDDVRQVVALREIVVVVDLVEVAGGGRPDHEAL